MRSSKKHMSPVRKDDCCSCGCLRCGSGNIWRRSVKRKFDEVQESGFSVHVDTQNEITALRDLVSRQRKRVTDLLAELEQERSASASATSEAMSMILRLQREKAEVQMEARQYKRFSEEKMAHDQQEIVILEKYLHALSCEVRISRNRLISHGVNPDEDDDSEFCDHPFENYPLLKCCPNLDAEKCSTSESSPNRKEDLQDLERRVLHLEQIPSHGIPSNEGEECAFMSPSPSNCELLSTVRNQKQQEEFLMAFEGDSSSDLGAEEENNIDRIYTVDAVHSSTPTVQVCKEQLRTPTEFIIGDREETDLRKLYVRLQALEADRESMKQAIMSMQTEKAQVLLKEIAQQIYGDAQPSTRPVRKLVKKQSLFGRFSLMSAVKWVASFVFWSKPPQRARYMFDDGRTGLLLLLENSPLWQQQLRRILPRLRSKVAIASGQRP